MKLRLITLPLALIALSAAPARTSAQATDTGPDTVVFAGGKRGPVTLTHGKHAKMGECVSCHHESKAEKPFPADAPKQKCTACHTDTPAAPMKTDRRNAMHDTVEKTGVCYSCHVKEAAAGKPAPTKCAECHKQES